MSQKRTNSPTSITLFDDQWNTSEDIIPADPPDHNVQLIIPSNVMYAVKSVWESLDIVYYESPEATAGGYFVMKAPLWAGKLYDDYLDEEGFREDGNCYFLIDFDTVLYVLENRDQCQRISYDLTEYFTAK